jgi:bifunctional ADP-heptose synthase (sugar kinase/adenylyltransferase)
MIVEWNDLSDLAGAVVMVDGSFDPIHEGHIAYFAVAADLGWPLFCNITSDSWTARKHPVLLTQRSRAIVIDSIRHVSYVHCANLTTSQVLQKVSPVAYVKGSDWLAQGGVPKEEVDVCQRLGVEIKYVDTVLNSSTQLINKLRSH